MESVGQTLLHERLRSQLTLDGISARTRISVKNLQAIENDEVSQFSSAFYYKTFVRQFAESLELDYRGIAEAVSSLARAIPDPLIPGQQDHSLPRVAPLRESVKTSFRWLYSLVALVLVLAACSSVYGAWRNSKYSLGGAGHPPAAHLVISGLTPTGE